MTTTTLTAARPTWSARVKIDGVGNLSGVSCPSTSLCVTVDDSGRAVNTTNPTAVSPTWSAPTSIDGLNYLSGVSCASTSLCVAVDSDGNAVVGHWSGALPPSSLSRPRISGGAVEGQVLTEAHGSWTSSPTSFGYRWEVCDRSGGSCSTISRATSRKYKLTASDLGHTIRVDESAGNADGPGGTATSAHTAVVIPSSAQIKASLLHAITPHGRAARIVELVRKRRYALSLKAITAGRVVIEWYYLPRGAHLASGKAKPQAVLVAVGKATFSRAGTSKVMIKLSVRGTRLLKQAKRLRLTALGTFTPATRHAVTATKRFTLLR